MRTPAKLEPQLQPVPHEKPVVVRRRRDRAHARASKALRATPAATLARHLGISESRVRHQRTDDQGGALTALLGMIADPRVDAAPIVAAVLSAFEERFVCVPTAELRARLSHLKYTQEHLAEAAQNRALQTPTHDDLDAVLDHAATLLEIATIESVLGPGEERAH